MCAAARPLLERRPGSGALASHTHTLRLRPASKVRVETHDIIYRVVDQVWDMMQGLMPHESEEQRVGVMEVKEVHLTRGR